MCPVRSIARTAARTACAAAQCTVCTARARRARALALHRARFAVASAHSDFFVSRACTAGKDRAGESLFNMSAKAFNKMKTKARNEKIISKLFGKYWCCVIIEGKDGDINVQIYDIVPID